jgi:hypothetical protein
MKKLILISALLISFNGWAETTNWEQKCNDDPIDGSSCWVESRDPSIQGSWIGFGIQTFSLLNGDTYICSDAMSYDHVDVIFKFDDKEPRWHPLEANKKSNKLSSVGAAYDIVVKGILTSKKVIIRTKDECGTEVTMQYSTEGFADALKKLNTKIVECYLRQKESRTGLFTNNFNHCRINPDYDLRKKRKREKKT